MAELPIKNPFIQTYLDYVEYTEPPRIFHIWSIVTAVSACLGRRVTFDFGISDIYPNLYVFLVGPPATRKSTAMMLAFKRLKASTGIRFAPDDTAGRRQGLITAIEGDEDELPEELKGYSAADFAANLELLNKVKVKVDMRDNHVMAAFASELGSIIGTKSTDMLQFLTKIWDGDDYEYQLRTAKQTLTDPLLTLIGCTTETNIARDLPPEAIGQGFTSRVIMVYASEKYRRIPRPKSLEPKAQNEIDSRLGELYYQFEGRLTETPETEKLLDALYEVDVPIRDPRFIYYVERRHTHLIKVAMCMAAARMSRVIEPIDVMDAHNLLLYTENFMPEALGEFGLSPLALSKQRIVDFIANSRGDPVSEGVLWAVMHRDMKIQDFHTTLTELVNSNKIARVSVGGKAHYVRVSIDADEIVAGLEGLL